MNNLMNIGLENKQSNLELHISLLTGLGMDLRKAQKLNFVKKCDPSHKQT
jgi:hypothetical protein